MKRITGVGEKLHRLMATVLRLDGATARFEDQPIRPWGERKSANGCALNIIQSIVVATMIEIGRSQRIRVCLCACALRSDKSSCGADSSSGVLEMLVGIDRVVEFRIER